MGVENLEKESPNAQLDEDISKGFREVGQVLVDARKEKNLKISQVAARTHIRQQYLVALEEGHLQELPERVYTLGFIRTYARLLDLDGEELIRRISETPILSDKVRSQSLVSAHQEEGPGAPVLIISSLLAVLVTAGGYFFLKPSESSPHVEEGSFAEFSHLRNQEEQLGNPSEEIVPNQMSSSTAGSPDISKVVATSKDEVIPEVSEQSANQAHKETAIKKIVLKAREPSWVEIRDEKNRVFFMRILQREEEFIVPDKPGFVFSTGNAGGIDIFVGGRKLPSLGGRGDVRRGIQLDALQQ